MLFALAAALPAAAQTAVTIHNRTGRELTLCRPAGGSDAVLLVRTVRGGDIATRLAGTSPKGQITLPIPDGETASLQFEDSTRELRTELLFTRFDAERGLSFHGALAYAVAEVSGAWAGRLELLQGPTPATRILPQNRAIRVVSPTELELH
jgi:hypothetical protein